MHVQPIFNASIYEVTTAFIGLSVRLYIVADSAVLAT